jgi:hypothetical protein
MSWLDRALAAFVAPRDVAADDAAPDMPSAAPDRAHERAPAQSARVAFAPPVARAAPQAAPSGGRASVARDSEHGPTALVGVVGASPAAIPVAAAAAGELRIRSRAPAALVCIWRDRPVSGQPPGVTRAAPTADHAGLPPIDDALARAAGSDGLPTIGDALARPPAGDQSVQAPPDAAVPSAGRSPRGASTPGARRLAARLAAQGLDATACGRLAWLLLDRRPAVAARQAARCRAVASAPVAVAIVGARPAELEPLLTAAGLCVAVLPADAERSLRELAAASLPGARSAVLPPLPAGPPRWAALAGLGRLRSLAEVPP